MKSKRWVLRFQGNGFDGMGSMILKNGFDWIFGLML